ncbi:muellerian-inhibiting factor [Ornithorhynchus anatinus]|uniref:Muellerian-inhibiting factor n=1 Tax=Ornithorhynchus anatinus TaxID=9258 RepID=W8CEN5_ORNAN|nr:muellerian-inhibiting factor [Ornithorhynchus anatinus]
MKDLFYPNRLFMLLLLSLTVALPRKGSREVRVDSTNGFLPTFAKDQLRHSQTEEHGNIGQSSGRNRIVSTISHRSGAADTSPARTQILTDHGNTTADMWGKYIFRPASLTGLREPVCRIKLGTGGNLDNYHLEVVGSLSNYENFFLEAVKQSHWRLDDLATFGICPQGNAKIILSLRRLGEWLAEPGQQHLVVLHLEEAIWKLDLELRFRELQDAGGTALLGDLKLMLLVFYPGLESQRFKSGQEFMVSGDGLQQEQSLCLSSNTRFLVLGVEGKFRGWQLRSRLSLMLWPLGNDGLRLSTLELQPLLFGSDDKCFTRMTPVLFLLQQQKPLRELQPTPIEEWLKITSNPLPSRLTPEPKEVHGTTVSPSTLSDRFLKALVYLVRTVLNSPFVLRNPTNLHLDLDSKALKGHPQQFFNFSEPAALKQLVESEEPLLLQLPAGSLALLEKQAEQWQPKQELVQHLSSKLQAVVADLLELPALKPHIMLLQRLLDFCQIAKSSNRSQDPPSQLYALLLLKVLQSLRAEWQERWKLSRVQRSVENEDRCKLQELTVDLRLEHSVLIPETYMANNCQGLCNWPQSDLNPNYNNHVVLLLKMQARGAELTRGPCCVPITYAEKTLISLSEEGLSARLMPNMVAIQCGCR